MTNPTSNYGFVLPTSTDLVTDLPADFEVALQGVDTRLKALQPGTTLGDISYSSATANTNTRLPIGTTGQVLAVSGGVPTWTTTADVTPLTTKGDLFTFTTADARLGVGTNGQVLQADSTTATGLKWATAASGLTKVQSSTFTSVANTGTTLDGIFTTAYKKYLVQLDFFDAVTYDADLQMQIYESGTLYADYYYGVTQGWDYGGGLLTAATNSRTAALTVWTKCSGLSASLTFFGVGNAATQPQWQGTVGQVQNTETMLCGGNVATNRSTTGLYFKVATGNFSGTVTVYGLAN